MSTEEPVFDVSVNVSYEPDVLMNEVMTLQVPLFTIDTSYLSEKIDELSKLDNIHQFCSDAFDLVDTLLANNVGQSKSLEDELAREKDQLRVAADEYARATAELAFEMEEKIACEAELEGLRSRVSEYQDAIKRDFEEMENQRRVIEHEQQRRRNAEEDVTPFHGIFNAIISGDAMRAIPFYSQIDGLISIAENDLEVAQDRLRRTQEDSYRLENEMGQALQRVFESQGKISKLEEEVNQTKDKIEESDRKTKALGHDLTQLQNVRVQIKLLHEKCTLIKEEVEMAEEIDDSLLIGEYVNDFRQLLLPVP